MRTGALLTNWWVSIFKKVPGAKGALWMYPWKMGRGQCPHRWTSLRSSSPPQQLTEMSRLSPMSYEAAWMSDVIYSQSLECRTKSRENHIVYLMEIIHLSSLLSTNTLAETRWAVSPTLKSLLCTAIRAWHSPPTRLSVCVCSFLSSGF